MYQIGSSDYKTITWSNQLCDTFVTMLRSEEKQAFKRLSIQLVNNWTKLLDFVPPYMYVFYCAVLHLVTHLLRHV